MGLSEASLLGLDSAIKPRKLSVAVAGIARATYIASGPNAPTGAPTITTVSGKTCVKFTGSGSITIATAGLVDVLVVGGGGGAGSAATYCGGGGGGVIRYNNAYLPGGQITVTVGAGGGQDSNGSNSLCGDAYIGIQGGRGGTNAYTQRYAGGDGGSGGGSFVSDGVGHTVDSRQGYDGGFSGSGGGGGGAGGAGSGTSGGAGKSDSITGSAVTYGAGGGGGSGAAAGGANTGNGGKQAAGGSGIVIFLFG